VDVKTKKAPMVAALLAVLWAFGAPADAEASLPLDAPSSRVFKNADPFATAPEMDLPSLTQQLRAMEERRVAASECVALCELAAGIDAHPFGVASAEPLNRSEDAWGNYRFTSELETSHNRFGFTGHYWDKEASLYYAKARYYDPFTARFTQADSFLGTIDDPPSLHRYFYANENPTMYVDPSGHIVRQIVDQQINDRQYTGASASGWLGSAYNFAQAFQAEAAYQVSDRLSFGGLGRQDKLVDQDLAGKITDQQYNNRTAANGALSLTQAALTLMTGGAATTAGGAVALGASTAVLGQGISDVGEVYGTKTKSVDDVRAGDYLFAAAFGGLMGYAGYRSHPVTVSEFSPGRPATGETNYLISDRRIARFQANVDRLQAQGMANERLAELQGRVEMLKGGYLAAGPSKLRGTFASPGGGAGVQGIDRVFRHVGDPTRLAVLESKYRGSFRFGSDPTDLLAQTRMGVQMSPEWVEGNIGRMITGPHGLRVNSLGWELGTNGYYRFMNVMNAAGESGLFGLWR